MFLGKKRLLVFAAAAVGVTASTSAATHARLKHTKRITTDSTFQKMYNQSEYQNGSQAPGYQDGDSPDQTVIINSNNGTDNNSPVSSCPIAFIGGASIDGSEEAGWSSKASVVGFDTKYLEVENGANMPYYIERKDYTKAKRIVMVFQGKPRDAWRYANLMSYVGKCAVTNVKWDTAFEDYIVTSPIIFNTNDLEAGGAFPTDLIWKSGDWASGGLTKGPGDTKVSIFKALDALVDLWFNQTVFPNLNSVVIAGHSAGAILAQRYAVLRESVDGQDANMKWFISDAGSYAWPVDSRPVKNPTASSDCKSNSENCEMKAECEVTMNQWPYGLNMTDPSTMNVYGRSKMQKNKEKMVQDYFDRRIQYTFAALDDGPGDTHCEAQFQGDSHIARGNNFVAALKSAGAKGFHTTYVANATHVDLELFIDPASQEWMFVDGITDKRKGSTTTTSSASSKNSSASKAASLSSASASSIVSAFTARRVCVVGFALIGCACLSSLSLI